MFESVLHSLLCFLLWLTNLWHCVVDEVRNLATAHLAFSGLSEAQVKARARKWPKVPHHLCLAITDSAVTYDPVARLVMWAIAAGVKEITIWDNQGMFVCVCLCSFVCVPHSHTHTHTHSHTLTRTHTHTHSHTLTHTHVNTHTVSRRASACLLICVSRTLFRSQKKKKNTWF